MKQTCDQIRPVLSAYVDGEASDMEEAIVAHLAECDQCRSFLDRCRRVSHLIGALAKESPASAVIANIRRRVRNQAPKRRAMVPVLASVAVVLAVLLWGGVVLGRSAEQSVALSELAGDLSELERRLLFATINDDEMLTFVLAGGDPE